MHRLLFLFLLAGLFSCRQSASHKASPIIGSWKLLSGTLIENGDTTVTDYTREVSFIKIINPTHFAFLQHDLRQGKDSNAVFVAGGGSYTFTSDSLYTENLEYCSDRQWEGNRFPFIVEFHGDTLIQRGLEKVESAGIERVNFEKYVRVGGKVKG